MQKAPPDTCEGTTATESVDVLGDMLARRAIAAPDVLYRIVVLKKQLVRKVRDEGLSVEGRTGATCD